jgi:hypothetical protein
MENYNLSVKSFESSLNSLKINRTVKQFSLILLLSIILIPIFKTSAQHLDVPYVPTPDIVVQKMLNIGNVGPGDYVIDLGSGDGRIVIAAAQRGAIGHGIDIDPERIMEARQNSKEAGVQDKVLFIEDNIFEVDFSRANVITMYLLSSVNIKLRPHLLAKLKPGSRLVSHDFDMDEWAPDQHDSFEGHDVYYWVIPANVKGEWKWKNGGDGFTMIADQEYQRIQLSVKAGNKSLTVNDQLLTGDRISFTAVDPSNGNSYVYSGKIEDNNIIGTVQIRNGNDGVIENWTAIQE